MREGGGKWRELFIKGKKRGAKRRNRVWQWMWQRGRVLSWVFVRGTDPEQVSFLCVCFNCGRFVVRFSGYRFTQKNEYQKTRIVRKKQAVLSGFAFCLLGGTYDSQLSPLIPHLIKINKKSIYYTYPLNSSDHLFVCDRLIDVGGWLLHFSYLPCVSVSCP